MATFTEEKLASIKLYATKRKHDQDYEVYGPLVELLDFIDTKLNMLDTQRLNHADRIRNMKLDVKHNENGLNDLGKDVAEIRNAIDDLRGRVDWLEDRQT